MRSVTSGLVLVAFAAGGVALAVVGCSADGSQEIIEPAPATTESTQPVNPPPPPPPTTDDGGGRRDAGRDGTTDARADTGRPDVAVDAPRDTGTPVSPPGTPCTTPNAIQRQACGICGEQLGVCEPAPDGGYVWSQFGFCQNEVAGGCQPGSTRNQACGLCGTQTDTCQNNCTWAAGLCTGQPANACQPGTKEFVVGLGCTQGPNSGKERTCDTSCQWGNYGACQAGPVNPNILVAPAVGQTVTGTYALASTATAPRLQIGNCPVTATLGTATPNTCVEIQNNTAAAITVSVWNSAPSGGMDIDTIMTAYNGPVIPIGDAARKNCIVGVTDTCNTSPCPTSQYDWAGMTSFMSPAKAVGINANNSVVVCTASYFSGDTGNFVLNVRREN
jgi:hypothetical protein